MIYNALIQPHFDYCSPLWDICGKHLLDKLQKFQNRAARIIASLSYEINSADVLESLGWETLDNRRQRTKSVFLYKTLNDYTAPNLKQLLIENHSTSLSYYLRSTNTDIALPFSTAGQNFGIAFLEKQKKRNQLLFLSKILSGSMQGHTSSIFVYSLVSCTVVYHNL